MTQPLAATSSPHTIMRFTAVPDGAGGYRHEMRPATAEAPTKGKRKRRAPDPLNGASSESAAQQLKLLIERIEHIEQEITELQEDRADVFAEAKALGFEPSRMRDIIALRKKDSEARQEAEAILEAYMVALGLR